MPLLLSSYCDRACRVVRVYTSLYLDEDAMISDDASRTSRLETDRVLIVHRGIMSISECTLYKYHYVVFHFPRWDDGARLRIGRSSFFRRAVSVSGGESKKQDELEENGARYSSPVSFRFSHFPTCLYAS
jgi:hypothetical protein